VSLVLQQGRVQVHSWGLHCQAPCGQTYTNSHRHGKSKAGACVLGSKLGAEVLPPPLEPFGDEDGIAFLRGSHTAGGIESSQPEKVFLACCSPAWT
jgi:hypothetical protein